MKNPRVIVLVMLVWSSGSTVLGVSFDEVKSALEGRVTQVRKASRQETDVGVCVEALTGLFGWLADNEQEFVPSSPFSRGWMAAAPRGNWDWDQKLFTPVLAGLEYVKANDDDPSATLTELQPSLIAAIQALNPYHADASEDFAEAFKGRAVGPRASQDEIMLTNGYFDGLSEVDLGVNLALVKDDVMLKFFARMVSWLFNTVGAKVPELGIVKEKVDPAAVEAAQRERDEAAEREAAERAAREEAEERLRLAAAAWTAEQARLDAARLDAERLRAAEELAKQAALADLAALRTGAHAGALADVAKLTAELADMTAEKGRQELAKQAAERERNDARKETADLRAGDLKNVTAERDQLAADLVALRAAQSARDATVAAANAAARAAADELQRFKDNEYKRATDQATTLRNQLTQRDASLAQLQGEKQAEVDRATQLDKDKQALEAAKQQVEQQLVVAQAAQAASANQLAAERQATAAEKQRADDLQHQFTALQHEKGVLDAEKVAWDAERLLLVADRDAQKAAAEAAVRDNAALRQQLAAQANVGTENAQLKRELATARRELDDQRDRAERAEAQKQAALDAAKSNTDERVREAEQKRDEAKAAVVAAESARDVAKVAAREARAEVKKLTESLAAVGEDAVPRRDFDATVDELTRTKADLVKLERDFSQNNTKHQQELARVQTEDQKEVEELKAAYAADLAALQGELESLGDLKTQFGQLAAEIGKQLLQRAKVTGTGSNTNAELLQSVQDMLDPLSAKLEEVSVAAQARSAQAGGSAQP